MLGSHARLHSGSAPRHRRIPVLPAALLALVGCSPPLAPDDPPVQLQIEGEIRDVRTGEPLGNATIELHRMVGWKSTEVVGTATSDSTGGYRMTPLIHSRCTTASFSLSASADGYLSAIRSFLSDEPVRCTEALQEVNLELEPFPLR